MNRTRLVLGLAALFLAAGCAYTSTSSLPARYRTIHVPAFKSSVREYDLQAGLTNAVRRKFLNDGRLRVVNEDDADLILRGEIIQYEIGSITYDREDMPAQFRVRVVAKVDLYDPDTDETLWSEDRMEGISSFIVRGRARAVRPRGQTDLSVSSIDSFPSANQGEGTAEAIDDLASTIFYRTVDYW